MSATGRVRLRLSTLCLLMLGACAAAGIALALPGVVPQDAVRDNVAATRLHALFDADGAWRRQEYGYTEVDGRWRQSARLPSNTPEAWERRAAHWSDTLAKLDAIPADALTREDQVNLAVFRTAMQADVENAVRRTWEAPFNSDTFFWTGFAPRQPYQSEQEWRDYIGRLGDIPRVFDEHIDNMERGLARGWSVPLASLDNRDNTIVPYTLDDAANPLLAAFDTIPATLPEAVRAQLRADGRKVVLEEAVPAYRRLLSYMRKDYLPRTRTSISAADLPDGAAFYRGQIREYVTRDMDPREIHELGLAEVARISAEMREVMARAGFEGSFEEFLAYLRSDPKFYARSPHELLATAAYVAKKVDGQLKHVLGTLPRYRFTILPVADDIAPNYTAGRGGLEACWFNTYDLPSRPLYNLPALTLHECSPGHSLQAALALEAPERPDFRQRTYFSGYGEGWALYTEWLGTLMGIYETPYEDFGRLSFEMWRAARLVIDTGLHEYGWSREQAIEYLASHAALSRPDIVNEVDRYISWPGQALSYYIGYKTIRDLRVEAELELGADFDQKTFHDTILRLGSVPLPVLEEEVRGFIAEQKAALSEV
ncbi:DUF885 domain-containing protein [Luteimonas terricola]|uniref:DUF885 domain-containing protein n=1 Tax=Luteimonas terricola TaxID=645597 RepID=A0ABQ2EFI9_9GAMM|nr:DUF885 family protein [Luteimonas terricola]GGK10696.1 hypothetical protein GCM10011394_20210 [Luteimonas terricola]